MDGGRTASQKEVHMHTHKVLQTGGQRQTDGQTDTYSYTFTPVSSPSLLMSWIQTSLVYS